MNINNIAQRYENLKNRHRIHSEIQITDDKSVVIDGCLKVISYDENYIKLLLCSCTVEVYGLGLTMQNFALDGVKIKGNITSLDFSKKESV